MQNDSSSSDANRQGDDRIVTQEGLRSARRVLIGSLGCRTMRGCLLLLTQALSAKEPENIAGAAH
jgi:hypothetical protein